MDILGQITHDVFVALWVLACAVALIFGAWALYKPTSFLQFGQRINRWYKVKPELRQKLDQSHSIERIIYRHHVLFGGLMFGGGLYIAYYIVFSMQRDTLGRALFAILAHDRLGSIIADSIIGL